MRNSTGTVSGNGTTLDLLVSGRTDLSYTTPPRAGEKTRSNASKPFVMWDGEATLDAGYCLFGNSNGAKICKPNLSSWDLLEFLCDNATKGFHFGYGFDYDVDNILMDVDKTRLDILLKLGKVMVWHPDRVRKYEIKYIPRKIFSVCRITRVPKDNGKGWRTSRRDRIRIDDVVSYFNSRYDTALSKFGIGSDAQMRILSEGKDSRNEFLWENIHEIERYWALELELGPPLMDKVRHSVYKAGFFIGTWHGPGAIAKAALKKEGMEKHKYDSKSQPAVHKAALLAYAGGRFERFQFGYYDGPVWVADINSAYPWAISRLPSLASGRWVHIMAPDPELVNKLGRDTLALWRVKWNYRPDEIPHDMRLLMGMPYPLFQRSSSGSIFFPTKVDNWYYTPEIHNLTQFGKVLERHYEITEAWVWEDDGSKPFDWVTSMYDLRRAYQVDNNPAQLALKLGLNSMYGSMAQRIGWDRNTGEIPKWHQIEWAGMVTSSCRALVWQAAYKLGIDGGLVSLDTDGIISTKPFTYLPNGEGENLGQWKVEKYSGVLYFQSGLYWLRKPNRTWQPPKTRGISRGRIVNVELGFDALRSEQCTLGDTKRMYLGFRHAMATNWEDRGKWIDIPIQFSGEHSGTRWHFPPVCPSCRNDVPLDKGLHPLVLRQPRDHTNTSYPHKLPWDGTIQTEQEIIKLALMESEI